MTTTAADIETRLQTEIAKVGRYHENPTEVVEAGPIVTDHYRSATLISDDHDLGTTWDLGAGLTLTTSWRYAPDAETSRYPIVDGVIAYDDEAAAELKADALATLRSNVADAVAAIAARTDIDLTDPDEIIEALDDAGIRAWTSCQNIDEYGIEVDTNTKTGLVELSCWCYNPTNLDAVDEGDVLEVAVDLDLAGAARRVLDLRRQLRAAEVLFASSAVAAQAAKVTTWQDVADLIGVKSRQAAAEQCGRWLAE